MRVWDVYQGIPLKILRGHTNWVRSVAFSPDGQTLVSGCHDGTVYLWNVSDGQSIKSFQEAADEVLSVTFSFNGQLIASGIGDGIIQIRRRDQCEFEQSVSLKNPKPYQGMNITGVIGLTEDQKLNLRALGAVTNE